MVREDGGGRESDREGRGWRREKRGDGNGDGEEAEEEAAAEEEEGCNGGNLLRRRRRERQRRHRIIRRIVNDQSRVAEWSVKAKVLFDFWTNL